MSARWISRRLATVLLAVMFSPVLASFLTVSGAHGATPAPTVSLPATLSPLIGESVAFDVSFVNGPGGDAGYGPYIDLALPLGADAALGDYDGLTFISATYLGVAVTSTVLTADASGDVTHPYAVDPSGAPIVIHGLQVDQKYVVLRLPFGSFTPGQPAAVVHVTAQLSPFADAGTDLTIKAWGGFQFGATPLADPATDPSIVGPSATAILTPTIMRVTKTYHGPENETATGPNYPRSYTIDVTVAPGQDVTNLVVTDTLPDTIQYVSTNSPTTPAGATLTEPSTTQPGGALIANFATIHGTGGADASFTFNFYVPRLDRGGAPVLPVATGAFNTSTDSVGATATWTPTDPNDSETTVSAGPATHTLTDKSIAIQKSVAKVGGGPVGPDDRLAWTISVQVSDYFALDTVLVSDVLGDGSLFDADPLYVPTLAVAGDNFDLPAASIDSGNYSHATPDPGTGRTAISFDVSAELGRRGQTGQMIGGCIQPTGTATPTCSPWNDGPTTATIVFYSIVQRTFISNPIAALPREVVEGDTLTNWAAATGRVLDTGTFNPTANIIGDGAADPFSPGTSASITIQRGTLSKTIYAINGSTTFPTPVHVSPGNTVTYRLTQTFPTSRTDDFSITDYLPLPVFFAGATTFDAGADPGTIPAADHANYGPDDDFHSVGGTGNPAPAPTVTPNPTANSVTFAYGNYALYPAQSSTADILFTVTVSTSPFADGLLLTNQARSQTANSVGDVSTADAIIQITLDQPVLAITKGTVGTDGPHGVFTPATTGPVAFAATTAPPDGGSCPRFSGGPITTASLAANPIDSNLSGVDAGDYVRFVTVVENTGHASAFDVKVSDIKTAGFDVPAGGLDMCVTDGTGLVAIGTTNVGGGSGLFDQGIQLVAIAPAISNGAPADPGTNIAIISYTLKVAVSAVPQSVITNTANLDSYANDPGQANHLSASLTDTATVTIASPTAAKTITGTSINGGTSYAIGEIVTYRLTLTVSEGTTPAATVVDSLPGGLAFLDCDSTAPISASSGVSTSLAGGFADACAGPTVGTGGQSVTFHLGTVTDANTDNAQPDTVVITYRAVVLNVAGNQGGDVTGTKLRNSAALSWTGGSIAPVTAGDITVVEPVMSVTKTASKPTGDAADSITFTITVTNTSPTYGGAAFGVTLADVIPAGMTDDGTFAQSPGGLAADSHSDTGGSLSATWASFPMGQSATFTYSATISSATTPGTVFTNTATADWSSLPGNVTTKQSPYNDYSTERTGNTGNPGGNLNDYRDSDSAGVNVPLATSSKTLLSTNQGHTADPYVAIGEIATYQVVLTIPEGTTPNARLVDTLPAGMAYVGCDAGHPITASADLHTTIDAGGNNYTSACTAPTVGGGGTPVTFSLGTITNVNTDNATPEQITITYRAVVLNVWPANAHGTTLTNSAELYWDGNHSSASTTTLTVVEPIMTMTKSADKATADAGDTVTYTVQIRNPSVSNNTTAFDIEWKDVLPAGMTYVGASLACAGTSCPLPANLTASGANLSATWDSFPLGGTATLTYSVTVDGTVHPLQTMINAADLKWTSLPGDFHTTRQSTFNDASTERTGDTSNWGGTANKYDIPKTVTVTVPQPAPVKTIVATSEGADTDSHVKVGEIVRVQIAVVIPEGVTPDVSITDTLPAGMSYLDTGPVKIAFVCYNASCIASDVVALQDPGGTLGLYPTPASWTASPHPTMDFPSSQVSGGPTFGDGTSPTFRLGNLTNSDRDNSHAEMVVIEFNVLVDNVAANNTAGHALTDTATIYTGATSLNAGSLTVTVTHPTVTITKSVTAPAPSDGGDTITYKLLVTNTSTAPNGATAYDVEVKDTLNAVLTSLGAVATGASGATNNNLTYAGNLVDFTFDAIAPGATETLTITANVVDNVDAGKSFTNQASGTWTSLPGPNGTTSNGTGSSTPGASGDATGERNGTSGGVNTYSVSSNSTTTTLAIPAIAKDGPTSASVAIGGTTTFDIIVTIPEGTTKALVVTDVLPNGLTPVSATVVTLMANSNGHLSADYSGTATLPTPTVTTPGSGGGNWIFNFGDTPLTPDGVAGNDSFDIQVTVSIDNIGTNLKGTVLGNNAHLVYTNPQLGGRTVNAAPANVTVIEPFLTVGKSADVSSPTFGATVTYTLTVSHKATAVSSNADAFDVVLTDVVPTGLTLQAGSIANPFHTIGLTPASMIADGATNTVTITFTSFPLGDTSTFTYQAIVGDTDHVSLKQTLTNAVTATWTSLNGTVTGERTGNTGDPGGAANNYKTTTAAPVVVSGIDLRLTKDDGVAVATAGADLTYQLHYYNDGNATALGVVMTETVPAGTTYTGSGWTCVSGGLPSTAAGSTCTRAIGSVAGGASVIVNFAVKVVDPIPPSLTEISNTAGIDYDRSHGENADPTPLNNSASDLDPIHVADLSLAKVVDDSTPDAGQIVHFTVTISNGGPDQATGVKVTDTLPGSLQLDHTGVSQGTFVAGTGIWTVGALDNGSSATLEIWAKVTAAGTVTNIAEVTHSDQNDPDSTPGNGPGEDDYATASVTPNVADLGVTKAVSPDHPDVNSQVTYTIVATNHTGTDATGVKVADALPAGLTFVSSDAPADYDSGTGVWTIGALASGASRTLHITATVTSSATIVNTATISGDQYDINLTNNTASATVSQEVDLVVTKTAHVAHPNLNDSDYFTVTVTNNGPDTATGVVITDALPAGLTYVSSVTAKGTVAFVVDGSTHNSAGTWNVGTLASGESATLTVNVTVVSPDPRTNTASVSHVNETQSDTTNDSGSATITPLRANLAITKSINNAHPDPGDADYFTIVVTNNGPDPATNVVVTDLLQTGLVFVSADVTTGTFHSDTGTWDSFGLAVSGTATLTLHVTVRDANDYTNTATVTADQYDPDHSDNSATVSFSTRKADIKVTKTADPTAPHVGTQVTFTVTAENLGPQDATQLAIHDALPAGLTYVSSAPEAGTSYDSGTGVWTIGGLTLGHTVTLTITARVVGSGTIDNTAAVSHLLQRDDVSSNDSSTARIIVPLAADLGLTKTVDTATPEKTTNVTYTITVTNHGPDSTSGVHVGDVLPAGLTWISDTPSVGSYNPGTGDWVVGDMANGAVVTLTITATVDVEGPIVNTAEVTASTREDPNSSPNNHAAGENDQASAQINAHGVADLSLTKVATPASVRKGNTTTYTIVLSNGGPDDATGVIVRDQLPASLTYVSSSGGNYNPTTGAWTVGNLQNGGSAALTITVRVLQSGTIINTVSVVASDQRDPQPSNDTASASVSAAGATAPPTATDSQSPLESGAMAPWLLGLAFAALALMASVVLASRNRSWWRRL